MLDRWIEEDGLLDVLENEGVGSIAFSPLAQGILTDRYLDGFPDDSRAVRDGRYLKTEQITLANLEKVKALNEMAKKRGQSLAQMTIAWILLDQRISSVLIGASRISQVHDNIAALKNLEFSDEEQKAIRKILH